MGCGLRLAQNEAASRFREADTWGGTGGFGDRVTRGGYADAPRRIKGNVAAVDFSGGIGASLEDQDAVFVELDFGGLPGGALDEYYRLLNGVTRQGAWEPWILYVLGAVEDTALWTREKSRPRVFRAPSPQPSPRKGARGLIHGSCAGALAWKNQGHGRCSPSPLWGFEAKPRSPKGQRAGVRGSGWPRSLSSRVTASSIPAPGSRLASAHPHPNPVTGDFRALHFFHGHFSQHWREPRRPSLDWTMVAVAPWRSLSATTFQTDLS